MREGGEGDRVQVDAGWTKRVNRVTTASPRQSYHPNLGRPDDGSTPSGLECLHADLCRALERVSTRPSAVSDVVLGWLGGQDARVWPSRADGGHRRPLPSVWTG